MLLAAVVRRQRFSLIFLARNTYCHQYSLVVVSVTAHVDGLRDACLQIDYLRSMFMLRCQGIPCSFRFKLLGAEMRMQIALVVLEEVGV